jgi:hypothetical protein
MNAVISGLTVTAAVVGAGVVGAGVGAADAEGVADVTAPVSATSDFFGSSPLGFEQPMLVIETATSNDKTTAEWMVFMIAGYGAAIRIFPEFRSP